MVVFFSVINLNIVRILNYQVCNICSQKYKYHLHYAFSSIHQLINMYVYFIVVCNSANYRKHVYYTILRFPIFR